jgi:hypothetical protein
VKFTIGGNWLLTLNKAVKPIANKYYEGKMKRTLKKESKVREIAGREAIGTAEPSVCSDGMASSFGASSLWPLRSDNRGALARRRLAAD